MLDVSNYPYGWHWIVGGDETRAWSAALSGYVAEWPADRVTRIASEAELVDVLAAYALPGPMSLAALRETYARRIDEDAETCRLQFITPGAGMALTYQEKFAQAQAVSEMGAAAANAMTPEDREAQFPTLAASVGLEAETIFDCAQLVLARYAAFAQVSLVIERARLSGKAAIASAGDQAAINAAYEAVAWPTP